MSAGAILGWLLAGVAAALIIPSLIKMPSMSSFIPQGPIDTSSLGGGAALPPPTTPAVSAPAAASATMTGQKNVIANSPTYGWDGIRNTARSGATIPIVYGKHRIGGTLLNVFKETAGKKQRLNMLIAVSEGEIGSIGDIEINGNPLYNYHSVYYDYRLGWNSQSVINGFGDTITEYSQNAKITTGGYIYTTRGTGVQAFEVFVSFPQGLYTIDSKDDETDYINDVQAENLSLSDHNNALAGQIANIQGQIDYYSGLIVGLQGQIQDAQKVINWLQTDRPPGWQEGITGVWQPKILAYNDQISGHQAAIRSLQSNIAALQTDQRGLAAQQTANSYRILNTSRTLSLNQHISRAVTWEVKYKKSDAGGWTSAGKVTTIDTSKSPVRASFRVDNVPAGRYDIQIKRLTPTATSFRTIDEMYLTAVDEILYDDLAYPNTALLGIRAVATDQLNGSMPTVTCVVTGKKIKVWNGAAWETRWSNNPAWIVYDLLISGRYGLGHFVSESEVDLDSFYEAAQWCDELVDDGAGGLERRCEWDGVIDSAPPAWDLLNQICSTFGGVLIYSAGLYGLKVSKPGSAVQMFTMGNIVAGSFSGSYLSVEKQSNAVDVQFTNKSQNYEMDMIPIETAAAYQNGEPLRKQSVSLLGITRKSQAMREGNRILNTARLIRRKIQFSAAVDSLACEVYDIVNFSHDLPLWGFSGRVRRAWGRNVELDREVTIQAGKTYALRIRRSGDDSQEELTVSTGAGTSAMITVAADWAEPVTAGDIYSFGEVEKVIKPFRITSITRDSDLTRQIEAAEYNAGVWEYDNIVLETPNYFSLPNPLGPPEHISALTLAERLYFNGAGELATAIDISFSVPLPIEGLNIYSHAEIYASRDGGATWQMAGTTANNHYTLDNVLENETYHVRVLSVSGRGAKADFNAAPEESIYVMGKTKRPDPVTGFTAIQQGKSINLTWDASAELDIAGYVIREGVTWDAGLPVTTLEPGTSLNVSRAINGTYRFWLKVVDTSGNYSTAVSAQVTVSGLEYNAIVSHEEITDPVSGTLTDFIYISELSGIINPSALTWADVGTRQLNDADLNSGTLAASATHTFETDAQDIGRVGTCNLTLKLDIDATDNNVTGLSYPNRKWNDYPSDTWNSITALFDLTVEINTSEDNITWSGWRPYINGAYTARYYKWRITVNSSLTARVLITALTEVIDVPDVEFWVSDFSASSGGSSIVFSDYGKTFYQPPKLAVTPKGSGFLLPVVSNINAASATITFYDHAGASVAGSGDVFIDGY